MLVANIKIEKPLKYQRRLGLEKLKVRQIGCASKYITGR